MIPTESYKYTINNLTSSETYEFRIACQNQAGRSSWANLGPITTISGKLTSLETSYNIQLVRPGIDVCSMFGFVGTVSENHNFFVACSAQVNFRHRIHQNNHNICVFLLV